MEPPSSPWFNPVEEVFSVVKRHYYKNGNIADAFGIVTSDHCNAFFKAAMKETGDVV